MHDVVTIETAGLGDRSYLIHDGTQALVVDPQRDIDRVLAVAQARRVQITHVLETHIHNDYVTGGFALASRVGIPTALLCSAVALVAGLVSVRRYPLTSQELQYAPSVVRD